MDALLIQTAKKIPEEIRNSILDEGFIDIAVNIVDEKSPMGYLFDVYEEFIDATGEHDDWTCFKCRAYILEQFRKLKPALLYLKNGH